MAADLPSSVMPKVHADLTSNAFFKSKWRIPLALIAVTLFVWSATVLHTSWSPVARRVRIPISRRLLSNPETHYRNIITSSPSLSRRASTLRAAAPSTDVRTWTHAELASHIDSFGVSVPMKNFWNMMYTGQLSMGTPAQQFDLVFDTGSADLWVFSSQTGNQKQSYLHYYTSALSSSYSAFNPSQSWSIQYGQGSASGFLSQDLITLGDLQPARQTFAETTQYSSNFNNPDEPMDGIMGVAMQAAASDHATTVIETLYSAGRISLRAFSFVLQKNPVQTDGSEMILGPPDPTYFAGALTWSNVISTQGMWYIMMDAITVNSVSSGWCLGGGSQVGCVALIDSGTSFIGIPSNRWKAMLHFLLNKRTDCVERANGAGVVCSNADFQNLPTLTLRFGGRDFDLQPVDYMLSFDTGLRLAMMDIGPTPSAQFDRFIMGDTFLKTYYTVFDEDGMRIGMGSAIATSNWNVAAILAVAVGALLVLSAIVYAFWWYKTKPHAVGLNTGVPLASISVVSEVAPPPAPHVSEAALQGGYEQMAEDQPLPEALAATDAVEVRSSHTSVPLRPMSNLLQRYQPSSSAMPNTAADARQAQYEADLALARRLAAEEEPDNGANTAAS